MKYRKPYKPSLLLKLFIAFTTWSLVFLLLFVLSTNTGYRILMVITGTIILIYNLLVLWVTHEREHKKPNHKNKEPWAI